MIAPPLVALKLVVAPSALNTKLNVRLLEASPSAPALLVSPNRLARPPVTEDADCARIPVDSSEASTVVPVSPSAKRSAPTVSSKRRLPNTVAALALVVRSTDGASSANTNAEPEAVAKST